MKKKLFLFFLISLSLKKSDSQLLQWYPKFITETSTNISIIADANKGNKALLNFNGNVYVHIGVITNKSISNSDWKHALFTWGVANPTAQATYINNNKWQFNINSNLRTFFNITDPTETILKIAILFRSTDGNTKLANLDGSDMFIPIYNNNFAIRIDSPFSQPTFRPILEPLNKKINDTLKITGVANNVANLTLTYNGNVINMDSSSFINAQIVFKQAGNQQIILKGSYNNTILYDTISFIILGDLVQSNLPPGLQDGINYESGDTSVVLVQYAPGKNSMVVIGDFNNWTQLVNYQMNRTNDSNRFWIRITGLTPGVEYGYQFIVDESLKVGDMYAEKILDPWRDVYITESLYPNLKPYPTNKTSGIVSVLQTRKPSYNWTRNYVQPNKNNLIIYELLLRDFVETHSFQTLLDTLPYFKRLGINAIELMPVSSFENNNSWGYDPNYYFSLDKYYGNEISFKKFIDACHKEGIAVIMDIVLNHCFGSAPMAQLYWDAVNNRPAVNNPWLNPIAKHDYNVGYDFNHESIATQYLVNRVIKYWLTNYNIDGFRWDLSKGFTQKNTLGNTSLFAQYDITRINIWKRIYDSMQSIKPNAYCILEHFADNSEEIVLANYGMMIWGNANYNFSQASQGNSMGSDFSNAISSKVRGWNNLNLVGYQESHDEERIMYNNNTSGSVYQNYNIRNLNTGLKRQEMTAAFWALIPGPKMLWQMGELGYDYPINYCTDGTINSNCRLAIKPIKWDYLAVPARKNLLNVYSKLFQLKLNPIYNSTFLMNNFRYDFSSGIKWFILQNDTSSIFVIGNFGVQPNTANISIPYTGIWSNYLSDTSFLFNSNTIQMNLLPGEYYVLLNKIKNACVNNSQPNIIRTGNNLQSSILYKNYNWYFGGNFLMTTETNSFTPAFTGVYSLVGLDSNLCSSQSSNKYYYAQSCITPTGRLGNAVEIQSNIMNENNIIIKWCPELIQQDLIVKVFELNGNIILERKMNSSNGQFIIDKGTILSNQYFIQVSNIKNEVLQISDIVIKR